MSVKLSLDYEQIKKLIDQLAFEEKSRLAQYLDDQTLFSEIRGIQKDLKDEPITLDEITSEVEAVREERYRARRS